MKSEEGTNYDFTAFVALLGLIGRREQIDSECLRNLINEEKVKKGGRKQNR